MSPLLMAAALVLAPADQPAGKTADAGTPDVSGKWLIVYAEQAGRRVQNWEQQPATFKDNTLTYEKDGKEHSITLKFGPHQMVKATANGKDADGVYIAAQDYLCVSLTGAAGFAGDAGAAKSDDTNKGSSSGDFILILRKQR